VAHNRLGHAFDVLIHLRVGRQIREVLNVFVRFERAVAIAVHDPNRKSRELHALHLLGHLLCGELHLIENGGEFDHGLAEPAEDGDAHGGLNHLTILDL